LFVNVSQCARVCLHDETETATEHDHN
jgi:hypothetical protein